MGHLFVWAKKMKAEIDKTLSTRGNTANNLGNPEGFAPYHPAWLPGAKATPAQRPKGHEGDREKGKGREESARAGATDGEEISTRYSGPDSRRGTRCSTAPSGARNGSTCAWISRDGDAWMQETHVLQGAET